MRGEYEAASGKDEINFDDRSLLRLIIELVRAKELDGEEELALGWSVTAPPFLIYEVKITMRHEYRFAAVFQVPGRSRRTFRRRRAA